MKIVFSKEFENRYDTNPVENPERVALALPELKEYEFIEPIPASIAEISRVHGKDHINRVKNKGLFEPASLAAGGAITAARLAIKGESAFALIRPPGHHASANRAWGLCFFNNMAIAIQQIRNKAEKVLIIDIDLHFGDGTASIFQGDEKVKICNPGSVDENFEYLNMSNTGYLRQIEDALESIEYDIIGISAGFDNYIDDWGGLLTNDDFFRIGRAIRDSARKCCNGKRFAILEGGYSSSLKYNIRSFIEGFA
jgi:acetoin utilization deacetylase AcuC-like enzyme